MATLFTRLAHAPIVASSIQNHQGSTYAHWVLESLPTEKVAVEPYERNLALPPGKYLVQVQASGPSPSLTQFTAYPGAGDSVNRSIPAGVTEWTTTLDIPGPDPVLRLIATGYDHLLLVLHRI